MGWGHPLYVFCLGWEKGVRDKGEGVLVLSGLLLVVMQHLYGLYLDLFGSAEGFCVYSYIVVDERIV